MSIPKTIYLDKDELCFDEDFKNSVLKRHSGDVEYRLVEDCEWKPWYGYVGGNVISYNTSCKTSYPKRDAEGNYCKNCGGRIKIKGE